MIIAAGFLFHTVREKSSRESESRISESGGFPANSAYSALTDDDSLAGEDFSEDETPSPVSAIEEERIYTFESSAALRAFLSSLDTNRFTILASSEAIVSVRLRASDSREFNSIPNPPDYNYTLLTPLPVDPQFIGEDLAFANTALDFIRAPIDNRNAGSGIKIAILDTGVRQHRALAGIEIEHYDMSEAIGSSDLASHGTAVASLISGKDGIGIAPAAELASIRVLDTDGIGDTFTLAEGIVKAVDAGANIINMSLGSYGTNQALSNAIDYATERGVVLVAAAGNEATTVLPFPAAYDSVIAVSAVDANGHPTSFANQNDSIDIAAPGVGVYAAWADEDWISFTGTSASTPYVSGAIAALSSDLDIPAAEAAKLLLANANDYGLPGPDTQLGRGVIDLQRSRDSNTDYTDLALSDIYLDPLSQENGDSIFHLTVQNRGTNNITHVSVDYQLSNEISQTIQLKALTPDESESFTIIRRTASIESTPNFEIKATAVSGKTTTDSYPQNDTNRLILRTPGTDE